MATKLSGDRINIGAYAGVKGASGNNPGDVYVDTNAGTIRFWNGSGWVATNLIPSINSLSGTIYAGMPSTLTLSVSDNTDDITVVYYDGGTELSRDPGVIVTNGSCTSTVPSAAYNKSAGSVITIKIENNDGTPSNGGVGKTVQALPSGGSITTSGTTRWHVFTSSSSLSVPSGFSQTAQVLVVAGGGGGGGRSGGGGGAGGLIYHPTFNLTSGTYTATIGNGGAGGDGTGGIGSNGGNSVFGPLTAIGGGGGAGDSDGGDPDENGSSGGSGGGGKYGNNGSPGIQPSQSGDSGTYGYGNQGGYGYNSPYAGGGGGGAGGAGIAGTSSGEIGDGGPGKYISTMTSWGTNSSNSPGGGGYFAGGGGGGSHNPASGRGYGGVGGGGTGGAPGGNNSGASGLANTGGGGGAGSTDSGTGGSGGSGGSGIVIVRYTL
jgi:hypothetical protein